MRHTTLLLAVSAALAACGGGGAGPIDTGGGGSTPVLASVSVTPVSGNVAIGATLQLSATALDEVGGAISATPQWQSDAPGVAAVAGDGTVSGVSAGTANVTATITAGGVTRSATAQVTVTSPFVSLAISHTDFTLAPGGIAQLTVTARDGAGNPLAGVPAATWQSDAPGVATVSSGTVNAVSAGSARITASVTHQGVTHTASVRVTVAAAPDVPATATVRGVDDGFEPANVTIAVGGTVTWVMEDEDHDITWDGSAPPGGNIAELDEGESATRSFPSAGTYAYHCEKHEDGEAGTVVVQGGGGGGGTPVLTSVTITPTPASVTVGGTLQLTAAGRDQFGNPMSGVSAATWQTSDATRATVSASGLAGGVAAGTATITATVSHNGATRSGTVTLSVGTVTGPSTASVSTVDRTFSPRSVAITAGGTVTWQFNATHNVTFAGATPTGGNIGNTSSGAVSRTFPNAGTYNYECTLHSNMTGTVTVQ